MSLHVTLDLCAFGRFVSAAANLPTSQWSTSSSVNTSAKEPSVDIGSGVREGVSLRYGQHAVPRYDHLESMSGFHFVV